MNTTQITGYCPGRKMTAKAIRFTIETADGESFRADTVWLPRSICSDLRITEIPNDDGFGTWTKVSATVPVWFLNKLDTRTAWEHAGMREAPFATRPY